jgi:hypothetical protein
MRMWPMPKGRPGLYSPHARLQRASPRASPPSCFCRKSTGMNFWRRLYHYPNISLQSMQYSHAAKIKHAISSDASVLTCHCQRRKPRLCRKSGALPFCRLSEITPVGGKKGEPFPYKSGDSPTASHSDTRKSGIFEPSFETSGWC